MWSQGAISHELLLEMLQRGETLPDIDIAEEIEKIEQSKLNGLDLDAAGGVAEDEDPAQSDSAAPEPEQESSLRQEVARRLRKLAEDDTDEAKS